MALYGGPLVAQAAAVPSRSPAAAPPRRPSACGCGGCTTRRRTDRERIHAILDEALVAHLGFVQEGTPFVIPTLHARVGDAVYVHGPSASRTLRALGRRRARLPHGHAARRARAGALGVRMSVNYRSVVVLGQARAVTDPERSCARCEAFTEQVLPGRWAAVRGSHAQGAQGTRSIVLPLDEASAKVPRRPRRRRVRGRGAAGVGGASPVARRPGRAGRLPAPAAGHPGAAGDRRLPAPGRLSRTRAPSPSPGDRRSRLILQRELPSEPGVPVASRAGPPAGARHEGRAARLDRHGRMPRLRDLPRAAAVPRVALALLAGEALRRRPPRARRGRPKSSSAALATRAAPKSGSPASGATGAASESGAAALPARRPLRAGRARPTPARRPACSPTAASPSSPTATRSTSACAAPASTASA